MRSRTCQLSNGTGWPGAANPRTPNPYGHIIRWTEERGDNTATTFEWDIFIIAEDTHGTEDTFSDPDGLWADPDGRLFIVAADHPARGALAIGGDRWAMSDRRLLLERLLVALGHPRVDGVLASADVVEQIQEEVTAAVEQTLESESQNELIISDDTTPNGIRTMTDDLASENTVTLAIDSIDINAEQLFDLTVIEEIYEENPDLKELPV